MAGRGTPDGSAEREGDTVASATRALVDATSMLSRLLSHQVVVASEEVGEAISASLREAARGLADASASVEKVRAPRTERGAQRRRERVDQTRSDLLDAAGRVFAAQGFEGASVGDVAAAAGYTKGAVYAHFGSKSELFLALARERVLCLDEESDKASAKRNPASAHTDPHVASANDLASTLSHQFAASIDDPSMLLALEVLSYAVRHPEARGELAGLFADSVDTLALRVRDDRLTREPAARAHDTAAAVPAEPTEADYDNAIGVLAIANFGAVLASISMASGRSIDAGARIITRLLKT